MGNNCKVFINYEKEGYLLLWLCQTLSKERLLQYLEIDYGDDDEADLDIEDIYTVDFKMDNDFNIMWYYEDKFEISYKGNMAGWNLLEGHSFIDSILPALKEGYQDVMSDNYNSTIIIYDLKYDRHIKETKNDEYGFFKYIGSFEYSVKIV